MIAIPFKKKTRFFYGWIIVAVCFLCWFVADAFGFYTFGLFIGPISKEFGWTSLAVTAAFTLRSVIAALLGPLFGYLADKKYGARILMSLGVVAAGAAAITVSQIQNLWQFYLFYGLLGALGMVGFGGLVTHTIIAKWFVRMRGRAMGVATLGVSLSGTVFIPTTHYLITTYGWRNALIVLGIIVWGLAFIPVVLFVRRSPEDVGLNPDGDHFQSDQTTNGDKNKKKRTFTREYSWTLKEALKTKTLWLILMALNIAGVSFSGMIIHFYPFLESQGISPDIAAVAMTTFAFACAVVKIPWGFVAERIPVRFCLITVFAGCALGLSILLYSQSLIFIFLYTVVYGVALGGILLLREVLFANYYGRDFLGTIRGVVMPVNMISIAGGPMFAGWLHDITGGYRFPYSIFLICFLIAAFLMFLAKPPVPNPRIIVQ